MVCRSCGEPLPEGARFCPGCASPVEEDRGREAEDVLRSTLENGIGQQFEIIRLIGRGGMGSVYLARERALNRLVAIKALRPEVSEETGRERFRREAQTAAKLPHPNIVPLHAFGEVEGIPYFIMGYVEGESLADVLRDGGKLPESKARNILSQLADALAYAHGQGVVHRDLKPDNILLDAASGRPMLTDFGIAKAPATGQTLTQLGMVVGTPAYMSPEQASGERDIDEFAAWPGYRQVAQQVNETSAPTTLGALFTTTVSIIVILCYGFLLWKYRRNRLGISRLHRLADGSLLRPTVENMLVWHDPRMLELFPMQETAPAGASTSPTSPQRDCGSHRPDRPITRQ